MAGNGNMKIKKRLPENPNLHSYRCPSCKKVVQRESTKQWVKSFCDKVGKTTHLIKVTE